MRRLFWIRVCLDCEKALSGVRPPNSSSEGAEGHRRGSRVRAVLRRAARPCLLIAAVGILSRSCGVGFGSLAAGALAAELLAWAVLVLIRAPFERWAFWVELAARAVTLAGVLAAPIPGLSAAARLDLWTVGFFLMLLGRGAWFGCWWNDLVDEPEGDDAEFERALTLGRAGSPVAPPSRRR